MMAESSRLGGADVNKRYLYIGFAGVAISGLALAALFGRRVLSRLEATLARPLPVSVERVLSDGSYTNVIWLHHSVGQNLIREGNVRALLGQRGYQFWDHDYNTFGLTRPDGTRTHTSYDIPELTPGARGGGNTDIAGLAVLFAQPVHNPPDNAFSRLLQHEVLMFKSCYPNSAIQSDESLLQHKQDYLGMRDVIDRHPDKVFIFLTTPPLNANATTSQEAARARALAEWLQSGEFLAGHPNLFVFPLSDLLADPSTYMLRTEYQLDPRGSDSHPNALANRAVGPRLVDFVDRAVQTYRASVAAAIH